MPRSNEKDAKETPGSLPGSPTCDDVLDRLELYLDGLDGTDGADEGLPGLSDDDKTVVEMHLTRCPACAQELTRARRIRDGLRALPEVPFELPGAEPRPSGKLFPGPWMRPWAHTRTQPVLRWAVPLAAAAVVLAAVLLALPGSPFRPPGPTAGPQMAADPTALSAQELARAELEARYALARLGEATQRARRELREDVLARHVVAPVQREIHRSFNAPPEIPEDRLPNREPSSL